MANIPHSDQPSPLTASNNPPSAPPPTFRETVETRIKVMSLRAQRFAAKVMHDTEKVEKLTITIAHIIEETTHSSQQKKFGYKIPSRNILQEAFYDKKKQLEFQSELELVSSKLPGRGLENIQQQIANLPEPISRGVCAGACLDFASKLLPSIGKEEFNNILSNTAKNFTSGAGPAAAVNQLVYRTLQPQEPAEVTIKKTLDLLQKHNQITSTEREFIEIITLSIHDGKDNHDGKENPKLQEFLNKIENPTDPKLIDFKNKHGIKIVELSNGIAMILSALKPTDPTVPSEKILKYLEDWAMKNPTSSDISSCISAFVKIDAENINLTYPQHTDLSLKEHVLKTFNIIGERINKFALSLFAQFGKEEVNDSKLSKKKFIPLIELQVGTILNKEIYEEIARVRGMKLNSLDNKLDLRGTQNDADYLEKLKSLDDGVYNLDLKTENLGHATLFIKNADQYYFWDPNYGLFECDKDNPKNEILKVISTYAPPQGESSNNNHLIFMQRIEEVEKPTIHQS